ncbi:hypothetical protein M8818_003110 [Zalaria obscura]|uniref:Uncharacterized protein n=1 Tax=Zalaria obscura TaxID=2024903 RepID=A0ACC3SH18_9PEZI
MSSVDNDLELHHLTLSGASDATYMMDGSPAGGLPTQYEDDACSELHQARLNKRVVRKLDYILLPFLSLLFLLNSLDRTNIGSAESAHFTNDTGLPPSALNTSVACFFAVFVALQPVGAALGRKYGMARWVPACMTLWGLCTTMHILVRKEWQLITLRMIIGALEAGFYPTTVSYLSLFYTRFEFAKRLGLFYGQYAVAGALGGILSWAVFSHFPDAPAPDHPPSLYTNQYGFSHFHSWEVLFMIEGISTIVVALLGFLWLPHSADTAWFFTREEREWAEERIRLDRNAASTYVQEAHAKTVTEGEDDLESVEAGAEAEVAQSDQLWRSSTNQSDLHRNEESAGLLASFSPATRKASTASATSLTADTGLIRGDILSALLDWKIWYLLVCNVLSALPGTAFSVFFPLVIKSLSSGMSPANANLFTAPPFLAGALVLWSFTYWSDRSKQRFVPILCGMGILLVGLALTVLLPASASLGRYISLTILLGGSFIASPLTIAWLTNNIPSPGKRAIVLGINGWGNLAGVFSALLFAPKWAESGYKIPFYITGACVAVAWAGYAAFRVLLVRENRRRARVVESLSEEERDLERQVGDARTNVTEGFMVRWSRSRGWDSGLEKRRMGDERLTFRYGL